MLVITYIGLVVSAFLFVGMGISYRAYSGRLDLCARTLQYSLYLAEKQAKEIEEQKIQFALEEKLQGDRVFYMNIRVTHDHAFGGVSALNSDGSRKKGVISLDQIMLYGKNVTGQAVSYYIEEQGIELCAMDDPDVIKLRSKGEAFEIRNSEQNRDQGHSVTEAVIKKDVLYYIILDSKHEITILATKCR